MIGCKPLLFELGTEELPPKNLQQLASTLAEQLQQNLNALQLLPEQVAAPHWYATPRRLAVLLPAVRNKQPMVLSERRGPAVTAAFTATGEPSRAAQGFARSCGVEVADLQRLITDKGEWLVDRKRQPGKKASELVPEAITVALKKLPIARRMRWGEGDAEFVRPVHWVVLLHGKTVIKGQFYGIRAGRKTYGHRFHAPEAIKLEHPGQYLQALRKPGKVIADFSARRQKIEKQIHKLTAVATGQAVVTKALLDEVTALVEWPKAILGAFDPEFLKVPAEALVSAMADHQKYFHLIDTDGKLLPAFITICNIDTRSVAQVRHGNERVLRARLSDARFFWQTDRKHSLASLYSSLESLLFHKNLGSVQDKSQRLQQLAVVIASSLGVDASLCKRAAMLAKCDLNTEMVGEFPDLQGTMGRYYALADGEPDAVAEAISTHYLPRHAGDTIPTDRVGQVLAIADKLDTLLGLFAVGEIPTGDKDPYALRRAALGLLRIMTEAGLALDLEDLLHNAATAYAEQAFVVTGQVRMQTRQFIEDRYPALYVAQGYPGDGIQAVLACQVHSPVDFEHRLKAVNDFRKRPEAAALAAANKRIANILKKTTVPTTSVQAARLVEPAEQQLYQSLMILQREVRPLLAAGEYVEVLGKLAGLRGVIDRFFDEVMVMVDDLEVRNNRLSLLQQLAALFLNVADITHLRIDTP
ncbi:MAG TPA: glycine--tRNA ligase subunit beta [Gammaproteobacteria bacterium]|nr:glycine--tRNA ligase subunit beta [Gammaproteobacteria bacterium]